MALINPCNVAANPRNTASECSDALKAAAMIIMVPKNATWTAANLAGDFTDFILTKIHASAATRWFPIFGNAAPIRQITEANENDVIETLEDGSVKFIRYGMYNRNFITTEGGLCLAEALMGMGNNYAFIEVDITGQVAMMKNANGTYSGFPVNLAYAPAPMLANLKTSYKNQFYLSFSPKNYVQKGKVFGSDSSEDILSLRGLYDVNTYPISAYTNAGSTRASGGRTITAVGADGDTYDLQVNGVSISGGPVVKTSAESTVTLLAAKIAAAVTAAVATNGGYTATNTAGALTVLAPAGLGATINAVQATSVIVGTITDGTPVAFTGGVTGTAVLKVGVKTTCGETDLLLLYPTILNTQARYIVTNSAGTVIPVSAGTLSGSTMSLTIPFINGTYHVNLISAATLKSLGIEGYEAADFDDFIIYN